MFLLHSTYILILLPLLLSYIEELLPIELLSYYILTLCDMIVFSIDIKKYSKEYHSALPNQKGGDINSKRLIAEHQQFCQVINILTLIN